MVVPWSVWDILHLLSLATRLANGPAFRRAMALSSLWWRQNDRPTRQNKPGHVGHIWGLLPVSNSG